MRGSSRILFLDIIFILSWMPIAIMVLLSTPAKSDLQADFHRLRCPQAETIVRNVVSTALGSNRGLGAGLLRMHFHDCFVNGCDGSVLIDSTPGNPSEKEAGPNQGSLRGFELGGPFWKVRSGRRDSRVSRKSDVGGNLPGPSSNFQQLTQSFAAKGLSQAEMITLSGAHTIGQSFCAFFSNRLYNFNSSTPQDPSLDPQYAARLKILCPQSNPDPNAVVPLDPLTPNSFDNSYFTNVAQGRGLFSSDAALVTDAVSLATVQSNSNDGNPWRLKFAQAMIKMSEIGVLTGQQGEIRTNCRVINS